MNAKTTVILAVAMFIMASTLAITASDGSDAAMTLTDGEGNKITLDGPADHIITIGVGVTATAIGLGALDKIMVCDSYSYTNSDPLFDDLKQYVKDGKIAAGGNIYSTGKDQLKIDIIDASEPTKESHFDKDKDVVLAVVSPSYKQNLDFLAEEGYKNVMYWSTVENYDDIVDFVDTISKVCTGTTDKKVDEMKDIVNDIAVILDNKKVENKEAFYVTYSSGTFKVGNTTSLTTVMIEAAGGIVITKDDTKTGSTIEVSLTSLIEEHPNVVIFADSQICNTSGINNQERFNDLRKEVGNDVEIFGLETIWNNFSIESAKGVHYMAGCMYPDIIDDGGSSAGGSSDSTMTYVAAGIVAVVILCVAAYLFMRGPGKH